MLRHCAVCAGVTATIVACAATPWRASRFAMCAAPTYSGLVPRPYVNAASAKLIDELLMSREGGYELSALMELAGLAVAAATHDFITKDLKMTSPVRILVLCGPGNNGGDGLVAARHLKQFGHLSTVFYPKKNANVLFERLALQANNAGVAFASADTVVPGAMNETHVDLFIDGLFGFSFVGPPREPFVSLLAKLSATSIPVVSIDIPSGWEVDSVPTDSRSSFRPAAVVSLTAPKFCMQGFAGAHYLGLHQLLSKDIAARVGVDVQQLTPSSRDSAQFIRLDKSENNMKNDSNAVVLN